MNTQIVWATENDVSEILEFISALAQFEKLENEVVATERNLKETLFGERRFAEVVFLKEGDRNVAFALFFHNYSTFLGAPGLYLEDLFVMPEFRGKGYGKDLLSFLAKLAVSRGCKRMEWWVLNWNQSALEFYSSVGARSMDEWIVQRVTGQALVELADSRV